MELENNVNKGDQGKNKKWKRVHWYVAMPLAIGLTGIVGCSPKRDFTEEDNLNTYIKRNNGEITIRVRDSDGIKAAHVSINGEFAADINKPDNPLGKLIKERLSKYGDIIGFSRSLNVNPNDRIRLEVYDRNNGVRVIELSPGEKTSRTVNN